MEDGSREMGRDVLEEEEERSMGIWFSGFIEDESGVECSIGHLAEVVAGGGGGGELALEEWSTGHLAGAIEGVWSIGHVAFEDGKEVAWPILRGFGKREFWEKVWLDSDWVRGPGSNG